ncbi:MAG: cell division protein FtsA [Patescibacteria group bacterium]
MYFTALDVGSSQIKALVVETQKDGRLSVLNVFKTPSSGVRKGEVVSVEDAVRSLSPLFSEIKHFNKNALRNIFVNVNGANIKMQNSRGIVAVSHGDNEIYQEDIDRVVKASQAVSLSPNRVVLHTLTKEFIVDGIADIIDPLGMTGARLEVNSLIIDAFSPSVKSLMKSVEKAGGSVGGLIYNPLATGASVLSKSQKELGAVLVDIGLGTTGVAVFEEDKLLNSAVFPVGAGNVTNDLAIALKCSVKTAEAVKINFGCAFAREISAKEKIDLSEFEENLHSAFSRKYLAEIIEARLAEIFELVNNELKSIGKAGRLPAGAVLAGGGAKMPGVVELAKKELKLPSRLGISEIENLEVKNVNFAERIEDSEFAVALGLLWWAGEKSSAPSAWPKGDKFSLKKFLKYFTP